MNVEVFYPSYTKKAITFTMDDGNVPYDKKFIDIVKPYGITGAFNLVGNDRKKEFSDEEYREFYRGYEITNHCKHHPKVLTAEWAEKITDAPFNMGSADPALIYPDKKEGIYFKHYGSWWGRVATVDAYIAAVDQGKRELEEIFGEGNIKGFVWPFCRQDSIEVISHLVKNYTSIRRTGLEGFDIPEDLYDWCYNATHANILTRAEEFEALPDDGRLKFFAFGVHPIDFERAGNWCDLEQFAKKYGSRPDDYWYATPTEIFEYADAADSLTVTENKVYNPSCKPLYIKVNEEKYIIAPKTELVF